MSKEEKDTRTFEAAMFTFFLVPIFLMAVGSSGPKVGANPAVIHYIFVAYLLACLAFMWGRASDV